jgi:hypothetical protein
VEHVALDKVGVSERQAYRYLEQAQRLKHPVPVGDVNVSFTVKLSRRLVQSTASGQEKSKLE